MRPFKHGPLPEAKLHPRYISDNLRGPYRPADPPPQARPVRVAQDEIDEAPMIERDEDIDNNEPGDLSPEDERLMPARIGSIRIFVRCGRNRLGAKPPAP